MQLSNDKINSINNFLKYYLNVLRIGQSITWPKL